MGIIMTPSLESLSAFSSAIELNGVSLRAITILLLSLSATWAILVIRVSAMPLAIFASVDIEQGMMTRESK